MAHFTFDSEFLHINDSDSLDKLQKKRVSASLITGLLSGCQARWGFQTFLPEMELNLESPAVLGTIYHSIVENFYRLPPEERTKQNLIKATKAVLNKEEYRDIRFYPASVEWVKNAVDGFVQIEPHPEKVKVAKLKLSEDDEEVDGLEFFVKGEVGDGVKCLGFVDRVRVKDDGTLSVEDWKTGKAKTYKPGNKNEEGLAEQRQQILYSMLLEQLGYTVSEARLIYPVAQHIERVRLEDEGLRERTISDATEANDILDGLKSSNEFPLSPSFLCAWCPLVKLCPKAQVRMVGKIKAAFMEQPNPEDLIGLVEAV